MHSTICEVNKPRQNCNRINILLLTTIMKFIEDISDVLLENYLKLILKLLMLIWNKYELQTCCYHQVGHLITGILKILLTS